MKKNIGSRIRAPAGFQLTEEMQRLMEAGMGLLLVANAYDCTGEEVDSVGAAHTVVVRIFDGERAVFEDQVEGSPCMMPARKG